MADPQPDPKNTPPQPPKAYSKSYLSPNPIGKLKWDQEHAEASLQTVYEHVVADAEVAIKWYADARQGKRRGGLSSRGLAVILISAAGLLPIVSQLLGRLNTPREIDPLFATFAIGAAAALVGFDQRFGWSSGWMRYVSTSMAIRTALEAFEIDWICQRAALHGAPPTPDQINELLAKCKEFANKLNTIVADETSAWVQEFQANLKQIDEALKTAQEDDEKRAENLKAALAEAEKQAEAKKPGGLNITVTNRTAAKGWSVQVDNGPRQQCSGASAAVPNLAPGARKVQVFFILETDPKSEERREERIVAISPGTIVNESFTFSG